MNRYEAEKTIRDVTGGTSPKEGDGLIFTHEGWQFCPAANSGIPIGVTPAELAAVVEGFSSSLADYLPLTGGDILGTLSVSNEIRVGTTKLWDSIEHVRGWLHSEHPATDNATRLFITTAVNPEDYWFSDVVYGRSLSVGDMPTMYSALGLEMVTGDQPETRVFSLYDLLTGYLWKCDPQGRFTVYQKDGTGGLVLDSGSGSSQLYSVGDVVHTSGGAQVNGGLNVTGSLGVNLLESIEDHIADKLVAGTGITKSYNDTTGEVTLSASGGGLTEAAADARYLQLVAGGTVDGQVGFGHAPVSGMQVAVGGRLMLLPPVVDAAYSPQLRLAYYNSTDPADITTAVMMGVAKGANEGITGTVSGDTWIKPDNGGSIFLQPLRLDGSNGMIGVNRTPSSEAFSVLGQSEYHTALALRPKQSTAPGTYVVAYYNHLSQLFHYVDTDYSWHYARGSMAHHGTYGTIFQSYLDEGVLSIPKPTFTLDTSPAALGTLVATYNVYDTSGTLIGRTPIYS